MLAKAVLLLPIGLADETAAPATDIVNVDEAVASVAIELVVVATSRDVSVVPARSVPSSSHHGFDAVHMSAEAERDKRRLTNSSSSVLLPLAELLVEEGVAASSLELLVGEAEVALLNPLSFEVPVDAVADPAAELMVDEEGVESSSVLPSPSELVPEVGVVAAVSELVVNEAVAIAASVLLAESPLSPISPCVTVTVA